MSTTKGTAFGNELAKLAKLLEECPEVSRFDTETEKEAWTLAHDFLDLEESCQAFTQRLLPKLRNGELTPPERYQLLLDVGEEFRHMLYHIKDSRFFRDITEQER
jgi:hypothetical protein